MVADRALSLGSLQATSTGAGKIYNIGRSWYALISGNVSFAECIIGPVRQQLSSDPALCDGVTLVQSCIEAIYREKRDEAIESEILRPQLLTIPLFRSRPAALQPLDKAHYDSILYDIKAYNTQTEIMVCGFDGSSNPHILSISDPGVSFSFDSLGHHSIGIGAEAARVRLVSMDTDRHSPLAKVIYGVFDAKVSTEEYQGISYEWDGEVLCKGNAKSRRIPRPLIDLLDREYRAFPRSPFDEGHVEPRGWCNKLDSFCKRLIPTTMTPKPNKVGLPRRQVQR